MHKTTQKLDHTNVYPKRQAFEVFQGQLQGALLLANLMLNLEAFTIWQQASFMQALKFSFGYLKIKNEPCIPKPINTVATAFIDGIFFISCKVKLTVQINVTSNK